MLQLRAEARAEPARRCGLRPAVRRRPVRCGSRERRTILRSAPGIRRLHDGELLAGRDRCGPQFGVHGGTIHAVVEHEPDGVPPRRVSIRRRRPVSGIHRRHPGRAPPPARRAGVTSWSGGAAARVRSFGSTAACRRLGRRGVLAHDAAQRGGHQRRLRRVRPPRARATRPRSSPPRPAPSRGSVPPPARRGGTCCGGRASRRAAACRFRVPSTGELS